jgi:hypothetical protein
VEQLTGYAIAHERIEERQRKSNRFKVWIVLLILVGIVTFLSYQAPNYTWFCTLPFLLGLGALALMDGIELYLISPRRELSTATFEQEMTWLFGEDWQTSADTQEYMLGQERIRRRQVRRRQFYPHLFISLVVNSYLVSVLYTPPNYGSLQGLVVIAVLLGLLISHAYKVFPSRGRLERQERQFGQALQAEIATVQPEIVKRKNKLKRDVQYRLGEDGELVEVTSDPDDSSTNPKQDDLF